MTQTHPKTIALIGAGGVASHFLPALALRFPDSIIYVVDGDTWEERNLTRIPGKKGIIGQFKAKTLARGWKHVKPITKYLTESTYDDLSSPLRKKDIDLILCAVDNKKAKLSTIALAEKHDCPVIFGCNEYYTAQAILHTQDRPITMYYPDILDLSDDVDDPTGCTGAEALETSPQLPTTNYIAGAFMLQLLELFLLELEEPVYEIQSTFANIQSTQ